MAENKDKKVINVPNKREITPNELGSAEHKEVRLKRNVPNLRFKEFSGEWEEKRLGEIGEVNMCKRILASQTNTEGGVPFYKIGTIGGLPDAYITKELFESYKEKYNYPYKGEVMITCAGTVGKCIIYDGQDAYFQDSNIVWIKNSSLQIDNAFLYNLLKRVDWRKLNSTTIIRIYNDDLRNLKLCYPKKEEQLKISKFLSLLDERIATQNKIIEELECLKKEITKRLFSQKANKYNRLDSLFIKGKAGGTPTSTNKEYYNGNIPFLSINDITTQGKYIYYTEKYITQKGLDNSSAWIVPKGCLIISMYASVGLVAINCIPISTSQAMFSIQLKDENLIDYLYYYLSYFRYRHIHKYLETGTQSNINADIVRSILIPDYGYDMNIKIANSIKSIDDKIKNEVLILNQYTFQKQHLLRQMFI